MHIPPARIVSLIIILIKTFYAMTLDLNEAIYNNALQEQYCKALSSTGACPSELKEVGCPVSSAEALLATLGGCISDISDSTEQTYKPTQKYTIKISNKCEYDIYVAVCFHDPSAKTWGCGCWVSNMQPK